MKQKRIAVIGAGIAGLTCAYELQRAGHAVTVYEKESHVGGRMSSNTSKGFIFDTGADHLCDLYDEIKLYCQEFDIPWEKARFLQYGLSKQRKIVPLASAVSKLSDLRLMMEYFLMPKVGNFFTLDELAPYDTGNAYDYMKRRVGREAADYYVDAFASTYQFHRAKEISVGALLGILQSIKTNVDQWDLRRTAGGMQALPLAFAKRLEMKLGEPIEEISADRKGVTVQSKTTEHFDAAVLCTKANASLALYRNPTTAQRNILNVTKYSSTISVAFRVPRHRLPNIAVVWVPYVENKKISGFVNESMKGDECIRGNETLLSTWLHEDYAKVIMGRSDAGIYDLVKEALMEVCPWFASANQIQNHDLQRWPSAMPKFYPGFLKQVKSFMDHGQGERGVFFCGDYLNAPWTEGAVRNGQRVAEQVISSISE